MHGLLRRICGLTAAAWEEVAADLARAAYDAASRLEGAEVVNEVGDRLGRIGTGLVEADRGERIELIFACDCSELLGYRHVLVEPMVCAGWDAAFMDLVPRARRD
jgi:hypothetical protein